MMVYFRKRLPEAVVNDCNERIVRHGLKVIRSSDSQGAGDDNGSGGGSTSTADQPKPSSQKQPNQGSLLIDATCAPVDIRHPTDLSLLNEAREVTEILIDAMHPQVRESFGHKPRTHRRLAMAATEPLKLMPMPAGPWMPWAPAGPAGPEGPAGPSGPCKPAGP
jgi:hypothetical protein